MVEIFCCNFLGQNSLQQNNTQKQNQKKVFLFARNFNGEGKVVVATTTQKKDGQQTKQKWVELGRDRLIIIIIIISHSLFRLYSIKSRLSYILFPSLSLSSASMTMPISRRHVPLPLICFFRRRRRFRCCVEKKTAMQTRVDPKKVFLFSLILFECLSFSLFSQIKREK